MVKIRLPILLLIAAISLAKWPVSLSAQATSQTDSVSIHLSLPKNSYSVGEKPVAVLTIKNIGSEEVWLSDQLYLERIHVKSEDHESPKTELHRHLLGDFRPGDGPELPSGPVAGRSIAPGAEYSQKWDLTGYYDLSAPGNYDVYAEIYDPKGPEDRSGRWLRTNTAHFRLVAPR